MFCTSGFWGQQTGPNPTDRAKLGSKRHLICDGQGIPLAVQLSGANRNDSQQALDSPDLAVGAIGTDSSFSCPAHAVDQVLYAQVPTFTYEFNDINAPEVFLPPVSFPYGATHGSELRYLFKLSWGGQLDGGQKDLSNDMIRYWTQFARSGDPNSQGVPSWPPYDASADEFQSMLPPSPMPEFGFATDHKRDFWGSLFAVNTQRAARQMK